MNMCKSSTKLGIITQNNSYLSICAERPAPSKLLIKAENWTFCHNYFSKTNPRCHWLIRLIGRKKLHKMFLQYIHQLVFIFS